MEKRLSTFKIQGKFLVGPTFQTHVVSHRTRRYLPPLCCFSARLTVKTVSFPSLIPLLLENNELGFIGGGNCGSVATCCTCTIKSAAPGGRPQSSSHLIQPANGTGRAAALMETDAPGDAARTIAENKDEVARGRRRKTRTRLSPRSS